MKTLLAILGLGGAAAAFYWFVVRRSGNPAVPKGTREGATPIAADPLAGLADTIKTATTLKAVKSLLDPLLLESNPFSNNPAQSPIGSFGGAAGSLGAGLAQGFGGVLQRGSTTSGKSMLGDALDTKVAPDASTAYHGDDAAPTGELFSVRGDTSPGSLHHWSEMPPNSTWDDAAHGWRINAADGTPIGTLSPDGYGSTDGLAGNVVNQTSFGELADGAGGPMTLGSDYAPTPSDPFATSSSPTFGDSIGLGSGYGSSDLYSVGTPGPTFEASDPALDAARLAADNTGLF